MPIGKARGCTSRTEWLLVPRDLLRTTTAPTFRSRIVECISRLSRTTNAGTMLEDQEQVWSLYVKCSCILVLKMHLLTWFTGQIRVKEQVIHSEEDRMWMKPGTKVILSTDGDGHPRVKRIRRLHRHDLATILPFVVIVPFWLSTLPSSYLANFLFYCFAFSNISYTLLRMDVMRVFPHCEWLPYISALSILTYVYFMTIIHYMH